MKSTCYDNWIRECSLNDLKRKLKGMGRYDVESQKFVLYLKTLPQKESSASFEIAASRGKLEAINLKNLPEFAIDVLKLNEDTVTESTEVNRSILFKPSSGRCILKYAKDNRHHEEELNTSKIHELDPGTQFTLLTNGTGCDMVLLLGRSA